MSPRNLTIQTDTLQEENDKLSSLTLVEDGIHILNQKVYNAILSQDKSVFTRLVREKLSSETQALAVNLGPGKVMQQLTPWVVDTIREISDRPLFFSAGIMKNNQVMKEYGSNIIINAVTAGHEDLIPALRAAREHKCAVVVLLVKPGMMSSGIDERVRLASEVIEKALEEKFPMPGLYLDPVLSCHPDPAAWQISGGLPDVGAAAETISLVRQLDSRVKTVVALGNSSAGVAKEKRSGIHARTLVMLAEAGVNAVLLNSHDSEVMRTATILREKGSPFIVREAEQGRIYSAA